MDDILLRLDGIEKSFGETRVLCGISLDIRRGEFITLLGSSGCGKTTTLRIIAGLERPDSGRVYLSGTDVTELEPNHRDVNTVFQNYALFPHMNVEANIGYSLRLKRRAKAEIRESVSEMLSLVQLSGYEKRMPGELSGGQRQRVAIARALVNRPKVLLLDEPLGALDLQLRRQMQLELKRLQEQLGLTFVYITHDQEEALNMSDRIAVMKDGLFSQVGSARDIYERPRTGYVARFVGNANILKASVRESSGGIVLLGACGGTVMVADSSARVGDDVTAAVRSEHIELNAGTGYGIPATVSDQSFAGGMLRITLTLSDGTEVVASRHGIMSGVETGAGVTVSWRPENAVLVDGEDAS